MKSNIVLVVTALSVLSSCGGSDSKSSNAVAENSDTDNRDQITQIGSTDSAVESTTIAVGEANNTPGSTVDSQAEEITEITEDIDTIDENVNANNSTPDEASTNNQPADVESNNLIPEEVITGEVSQGNKSVDSENTIDTTEEPTDSIPPVNMEPVSVSDTINAEAVDETRTRPANGTFSSSSLELKSNGANVFSDIGDPPQRVDAERVASWPGLRFGNFLVTNNPWNASAISYPQWFQEISLYETQLGYGVMINWDLGAETDTVGSIFNTRSFPEIIFGTKAETERSGTFADTGLPVEIYDAPDFTIDYEYENTARRSLSPTPGNTDSEFNIVIESLFHSSCDIRRTGDFTDNRVFEAMVWLKAGNRKPSGDAPRGLVVTSDGREFDVYTKVFSNPSYIAFVARQEQTEGTVQYGELMLHAFDNASEYGIYQLKATDCMANILTGTEIWHGAGTFNLNKLQINRIY